MPLLDPRNPGVRSLLVPVAVSVLVAAAVTAFTWPVARLAPRDVPMGLAGPTQAVDQLEQRLDGLPGSFDVHRYPDGAAARAAIRNRTVYGALVATPTGPQLLLASAASATVAQALREAVSQPGQGIETVDVVPSMAADPRGLALTASILPLTLAGVIAGGLAAFLVPTRRRQVLVLAVASVGAGLTALAIAQSWLGVLGGTWIENAAVVALAVLAISSTLAGAAALLGRLGVVLAVGTMVFVGNPWAGVAAAPELLPRPVGAIGQLLPPGALGNLLRRTAFFDGAGAGRPLLVLCIWAAVGLAAIAAGARLRRAPYEAST